MATQVFAAFQRSISRFCIFTIGLVLSFSLIQPSVQAMPEQTLAASGSQVGEQTSAFVDDSSPDDIEQKRAERRALQSSASKAANDEESAGSPGSLGEVIVDKLNLDEIVEENVIVDEARDVLELDK